MLSFCSQREYFKYVCAVRMHLCFRFHTAKTNCVTSSKKEVKGLKSEDHPHVYSNRNTHVK